MSIEVLPVEVSDEVFTAWMTGNLHQAADHFGVRLDGGPLLGWRLRTISAPAVGPDDAVWLRVESARPEYAGGDGWTGNTDANTLPNQIPRPRVLDSWQWASDGRVQRAELSTRLAGAPPSAGDVLHDPVELPDTWWRDLRDALDLLRPVPTRRVRVDQELVDQQAIAAFGTPLPVRRWETVHGDLHWTNVLAPRLGILDWELWGRGPAGTDAASLLCHSLLVPTVADRVHDTFADVLDSEDGRIAQQAVAARMLARVQHGDYPQIEQPLRKHLARLLAG